MANKMNTDAWDELITTSAEMVEGIERFIALAQSARNRAIDEFIEQTLRNRGNPNGAVPNRSDGRFMARFAAAYDYVHVEFHQLPISSFQLIKVKQNGRLLAEKHI